MATAMRPTTTEYFQIDHADPSARFDPAAQFQPAAMPVSFDPFQSSASAARPHSAGVYVRRQIGAVIAAVVLAYMAWMMLAMVGAWFVTSADAAETVGDVPAMTHVVESGDTLWSIASTIDADRDIRNIVASLREANGGAAELQPGQVLNLRPAYG